MGFFTTSVTGLKTVVTAIGAGLRRVGCRKPSGRIWKRQSRC